MVTMSSHPRAGFLCAITSLSAIAATASAGTPTRTDTLDRVTHILAYAGPSANDVLARETMPGACASLSIVAHDLAVSAGAAEGVGFDAEPVVLTEVKLPSAQPMDHSAPSALWTESSTASFIIETEPLVIELGTTSALESFAIPVCLYASLFAIDDIGAIAATQR